MEENKQAMEGAQALSVEDVAGIAGGTGDCGATVQIGPVINRDDTVGGALIGVYDGLVDATSHVIETVANAVK